MYAPQSRPSTAALFLHIKNKARNMLTRLCLTGTLLLSTISLYAHATTPVVVNFDDYASVNITPMGNSPGAPVPANAQLSNQYLATDGVTFSSVSPYVALGFFGSSSSPAGIGGVTSDGLLSYDVPVNIAFFLPGTSTPAITNFVSISGDPSIIANQNATFSAFDVNGALIQSVTQLEGSTPNNTWSLSDPGIHSVSFSGGNQGQPFGSGTGIALDDLTFNPSATLLLGDANGDGHVDLTDLSTVLNNFGSTTTLRSNGNFDGAPTIDLTDLSDVLNNFGATTTTSANNSQLPITNYQLPTTPTPEPTTLLLAAAPLLLPRRRNPA